MKKHEKAVVNYLSEDSLKNLLARPDQATIYGRRDAALLCVLYDTGARVQAVSYTHLRAIFSLSPEQLQFEQLHAKAVQFF